MKYSPKPIDTSKVVLPPEILGLTETLAKNTHDTWARGRLAEGWTYGHERNDVQKTHPCLIPYESLPESERQYDRDTAMQALKTVIALGYAIESPRNPGQSDLKDCITGLPELIEQLRNAFPMTLTQLLAIWDARSDNRHNNQPEFYQRLGQRILKLGEPLLAYDVLQEGMDTWPNDVRILQLSALALARNGAVHRANAILLNLRNAGYRDGETSGILARTYKDMAKLAKKPGEAKKHLLMAHAIYDETFAAAAAANNTDDAIYNGINAAATALLTGQKAKSKHIANRILEICRNKPDLKNDYWALASMGEASIILGDLIEAEDHYLAAVEVGRGNFADLSSTRQQARSLLAHLGTDRHRLDACFKMPRVLVFSGHMLDQPGRSEPRFPAVLEDRVRREISAHLEKAGAGIGYSSAACGSDILFLEAMIKKGAEINIVLPFKIDLFRQTSVDIMENADWGNRFESVLEKASRIIVASEHTTQATPIAYEYTNLLQYGLASLRAKTLATELHPLAVWNGRAGEGPGGTDDSIKLWQSRGATPDIIHLDTLMAEAGRQMPATDAKKTMPANYRRASTKTSFFPQEIRAMLFFDVVGYGKLTDEQIPKFIHHFMGAVSRVIRKFEGAILAQNTWGDALYCVFNTPEASGNFALSLRDQVCKIDWQEKGLPKDLNLRISLHAGPIFSFIDPVLKKLNFSGAHVSRAARIEPITPPGQVYASQQFAALAGSTGVTGFTCEYVGQVPLPKKSGIIPLYLVQVL